MDHQEPGRKVTSTASHNIYKLSNAQAPSGRTAMAQVELKKSVDELLDDIASDNAELFELLATNGRSRAKK
jgi:hypothetical protein